MADFVSVLSYYSSAVPSGVDKGSFCFHPTETPLDGNVGFELYNVASQTMPLEMTPQHNASGSVELPELKERSPARFKVTDPKMAALVCREARREAKLGTTSAIPSSVYVVELPDGGTINAPSIAVEDLPQVASYRPRNPIGRRRRPAAEASKNPVPAAPRPAHRQGQKKGLPQAIKMHRRDCNPYDGCQSGKCALWDNHPQEWQVQLTKRVKNPALPVELQVMLWKHL